MTSNSLRLITLALSINSVSFIAFSHGNEQIELDNKCEEARQVALAPRKKEIYLECRNKFKKSEAICKEDAQAYNGNRIGGAPMFYELPECEKAFNYRNKHKE